MERRSLRCCLNSFVFGKKPLHIVQTGVRHVHELRAINREFTEKALHMHCLGYLSQVKAGLLTETIFEIEAGEVEMVR